MQDDLLRGFFGEQLGSIHDNFGVRRRLVRIGDPGKLLDDSRPCFGIQALAVALLTNLQGGGQVHENEASPGLDHLPDLPADGVVRGDRSTDGDAAVLGDLGGDVADPADINVAVLLGEAQLRSTLLANQVAVEGGYGTSAHLQELSEQDVGDGGLSGAGKPGEKNGQALKGAGGIAAAEFLDHLGVSEPPGNFTAFV